MALIRVARAEEVPPGRTCYRVVDGRPLLLVRQAGRIHAFDGRCPHRNNPLDGAVLWGDLITCPWHNFQYSVNTGENHYPRNVYPDDMPQLRSQLRPLRVYRAELRGGDIWVDLE